MAGRRKEDSHREDESRIQKKSAGQVTSLLEGSSQKDLQNI
jgi:hypothetical protein